MTNKFNDMIVLGESKKEKKGDGVNEVLNLMKEIRDFQEQVSVCAEAQNSPENRSKIEEFSGSLEKMYGSLLDMARNGVKTIRKMPPEDAKIEERPVEKGKVVLNAPVAPTI